MFSATEVRELLRENIVEVVFVKANGDERRMFCTLIEEFLPSMGETIATQSPQDGNVIVCWDLEQDAWRSFRLDKIKTLEFEPVE